MKPDIFNGHGKTCTVWRLVNEPSIEDQVILDWQAVRTVLMMQSLWMEQVESVLGEGLQTEDSQRCVGG